MKMKVYTAHRGYDYEGFTIIGVFSKREDAENCCQKDKYGDYWEVEGHEVDETNDN